MNAIQNLAKPQTAHLTKKGNKVQIDAVAGSRQPSFSLEEGDILVRFATGRLLALNQNEFEELYDYDVQRGWLLTR